MMPTSVGEADANGSGSAAAEVVEVTLDPHGALLSGEGEEPAMPDAEPGQPYTKVKSDSIGSLKHLSAKLAVKLTKAYRRDKIGEPHSFIRLPEFCIFFLSPDGKAYVIRSNGFKDGALDSPPRPYFLL